MDQTFYWFCGFVWVRNRCSVGADVIFQCTMCSSTQAWSSSRYAELESIRFVYCFSVVFFVVVFFLFYVFFRFSMRAVLGEE